MAAAETLAGEAPAPLVVRRAGAVLAALRPRQWSKNLLLFAGLVFAAKLGDAGRWLDAGTAFLAYCAASGASYLVNDVLDAERDRLHPTKRQRPVASGELAPGSAVALALGLAVAALGLAGLLGPTSILYLGGFLGVQGAYSLRLKHVVGIDVLAIAGLFLLRAAAGAEAVDVPISPWLLICTALLALFLGLAKRRGELVSVGADVTPRRPVLAGYSLALLDRILALVAGATLIAYSLYTVTARDSWTMVATIPFVGFGIVRYLLLVHRRDLGEEPENVLLSDAPILATVAAWTVTAAAILALD